MKQFSATSLCHGPALLLAAPAATQLVFADPGDEPITPTSPRNGDELR